MKKISEKQNDTKKILSEDIIIRSKIFIIIGTIIIVFAILVIMADIGLRLYSHYFAGYFAMLAFLAYLFGLVLVVYSIHLVRNKWGWLDFPIFIAVFYIGQLFAPNLPEMPIPYRIGWLLIFPLNYVALLILFLVSINKEKVI